MDADYDLLVAGAGVAGVPAAVSAARRGLRVAVVEAQNAPGGSGVLGLHRHLCGLYLNGPHPPAATLHGGLTEEIVERLRARAPGSRPVKLGRVWALPFEGEHLQAVYEALLTNEPRVDVFYRASLRAVEIGDDGEAITAAQIDPGGEVRTLRIRSAIDATGCGALIRLARAPFRLAPLHERQLPGCTVHLEGIAASPGEVPAFLGLKIARALARLPEEERQELPLFAGFSEGSRPHEGFCKFTLPRGLELSGSHALPNCLKRLHALLAACVPELSASRIVRHSPAMEREGLRLEGEWELDEASLLAACKFPDAAARSAWPVEFWAPDTAAPQYAYPPDGDYAEIPRRCLRSRQIANLFATGRCLSASSRALAATRVMGCAMALGEAAGNLAASLGPR